MFSAFLQHRIMICIVLLFLVLSILCQIMIGVLYQKMIRETDNMAVTENKLLKQCKLKFSNCYELNDGIVNIPVFVEKFMNRISLGGISLNSMTHMSGQCMLLSVFVAGIGACRGIIGGETIGDLLPFYIISFFGLYVYFSVASIVDVKGKRNIVKTNMVDYLENHMVKHLILVKEEEMQQHILKKENREPKISEENPPISGQKLFSKREEEELEALLKEFFV